MAQGRERRSQKSRKEGEISKTKMKEKLGKEKKGGGIYGKQFLNCILPVFWGFFE